MAVPLERFGAGDVYIDFPFEDMMFHYVKETGRVFRRFYGETHEDEIPHSAGVFCDAISAGTETTAEDYAKGRPAPAGC